MDKSNYDSSALDHILEDGKHFNARLKESQFKEIVLPILTYAFKSNNNDASLEPWLEITGSWTRGIDVLDDNTEELLFKVPALVGRTKLPEISNARDSAYETIENAKKKMIVSPRAGEEHLAEGLGRKMEPDGDHEANQQRWNAIFKRYGLEEMIVGDVKEADLTDTKASGGNENIEGYDEV